MRVMVTGCGGQVGAEVVRQLGGGHEIFPHDRATLDLSDTAGVRARVRELRPDAIVNAGAYTAVDKAEGEPELAHAVNAAAPQAMAEELRDTGGVLLHFSTDYVFDGSKAGPYVESDPTAPLNAYGASKLAGEQAIAATGCRHLVLRTSWVYGPHGRNFMLTMLRLAETRDELRVVDDQSGAPTSSLQLAALVGRLLHLGTERLGQASGVYHATAAGRTTWCGFATEIFAQRARQVPAFRPPRVLPIASGEFPTPARRPKNSVLSNARIASVFGVAIPDWREGLSEALSALPAR